MTRVLLIFVVACSSSPAASSDAPVVAADTWSNYAGELLRHVLQLVSQRAGPDRARLPACKAVVAANMAVMRCGVAAVQDPSWNCGTSAAPRQFPIGNGPKPTDAERARLVAWITAGEP